MDSAFKRPSEKGAMMTLMKRLPLFCALLTLGLTAPAGAQEQDVERWGIFELQLAGPDAGNPYVDVQLACAFQQGEHVVRTSGFYDGDGVYRVRFMPDALGEWTYKTTSNIESLNAVAGRFVCGPPSPGNHGPVGVENTFKLAYADGTPHFSVGTTCYAWTHQGDAMEEQTLATLQASPFNKIRMCVFPKAYAYNNNPPERFPYAGKPLKDWDFQRFNPDFWKHFEMRIAQLRDMGIEADIIIFHPYDRWGFKDMGHENNLFLLRYLVARLAAYRNVWWSFANEFDLLNWPTEHWDEYMRLVQEIDPYNRLRGIHNCREFYDHTKPWVTHCSIQRDNFDAIREYRDAYGKPLVFDECRYEGDIPQGWGNLSPQQMTRYFWLGTVAGAYVGHGETYKHPEDLLWWAKGGVLRGQSPSRIQFLKDIVEALPFQQMEPDFSQYPETYVFARPGHEYLIYFSRKKPFEITLPGDGPYKLDHIDTWNMRIHPLGSVEPGVFRVDPPSTDYALRLVRYEQGEARRPEMEAQAHPAEGTAPLEVQFTSSVEGAHAWDFGDGKTSTDRNPRHVFEQPGVYAVSVRGADPDGQECGAMLTVRVDRDANHPLVRFGFPENNYPDVTLHGESIQKLDSGGYDLGSEPPYRWIQVGSGPIGELEGARSFTVAGWLKAASLQSGAGGNRILFSLQHNRDGIDIVHHNDGAMRLAVNEWPDGIRNDSSPGRVKIDQWVFFAVTYDAAKSQDSVHWYFGDLSTAAALDRTTSYQNGPIGSGSGDLVIGNFNRTLQGAGLDRQFRGAIQGLEIYASMLGERGALALEGIQAIQAASRPGE